jgi:hypothetical protein
MYQKKGKVQLQSDDKLDDEKWIYNVLVGVHENISNLLP